MKISFSFLIGFGLSVVFASPLKKARIEGGLEIEEVDEVIVPPGMAYTLAGVIERQGYTSFLEKVFKGPIEGRLTDDEWIAKFLNAKMWFFLHSALKALHRRKIRVSEQLFESIFGEKDFKATYGILYACPKLLTQPAIYKAIATKNTRAFIDIFSKFMPLVTPHLDDIREAFGTDVFGYIKVLWNVLTSETCPKRVNAVHHELDKIAERFLTEISQNQNILNSFILQVDLEGIPSSLKHRLLCFAKKLNISEFTETLLSSTQFPFTEPVRHGKYIGNLLLAAQGDSELLELLLSKGLSLQSEFNYFEADAKAYESPRTISAVEYLSSDADKKMKSLLRDAQPQA